jgi:hypothetical protein
MRRRDKTAAVNKFRLLSFGKIRSTEKFEGAEFIL